MKNKLRKIIEQENPFNPYKDDQIADLLHTTRYNVVRLRKKENIESYHIRRMPFLLKKMEEIVLGNENISTVCLTQKLNEMDFDVSRFLVAKLRNSIFNENRKNIFHENTDVHVDAPIVPPAQKMKTGKNNFDDLLRSKFASYELIGENGSIKNSLQLMRAAMVYPPKGLHTIIVGETGTGKSKLVDTVYKKLISSGEISADRKLVKYNCANYANNPELLTSQLFGHLTGTFTGANSDKDGIIKEASGGILFLDEIHRLSKVGQEMLFSVIDDGKYRRLGQNCGSEYIDVMIIGATTEDINSAILDTFKRRIPMIIELPSLINRSVNERFQLIVMILQAEANNIGKRIMLSSFCLVNLLTYRCLGNIGQLSSDIKVAVASAYVKFLDTENDYVELKMSNFPKAVQECVTKQLISPELNFYRDHAVLINPNGNQVIFVDERQIDIKPDQICDMLQSMYISFQKQELPELLISNLMYREIKYRISQMIKIENGILKKSCLQSIKKETLTNQEIYEVIVNIEEELGKLNKDVKSCLMITLKDIFKKICSGWEFPDLILSRAEKDFLMEYRVALEALNKAFVTKNYSFPKIIVGIVATYIHFGYIDSRTKGNVRVVIITHGKVASAIADICNYYTHEKILSAIDLPLDLDKEKYFDYVIKRVSEFEEKSLLLLVDLGTPLLLGEIISQKTNKLTKTIVRVDLALALEATIKAKKKDITLTEIYDYLRNKKIQENKKAIGRVKTFENLIIVSCITGQGAANNIKTYIKENFNGFLSNVEILPFGVITPEIFEYIKKLMDAHNVIACIGSYFVDLGGIPFIKISELVQDNGKKKLMELLGKRNVKVMASPQLSNYFFNDAIFFNQMYLNKVEAISDIANKLYQFGYVTKEYRYNVLKREAFISTDYKYGVSLPHTGVEYVKKSVISITKFAKPILWTKNFECDIMFMLALKKEDVKVIRELRRSIENKEFLSSINEQNKKRMLEIIVRQKENKN